MGKKNKSKLGIKTSRYFTKECSNCGYEYPNWFVSCPKCGAAWDDTSIDDKAFVKKNVKIVAKVTEEDFQEPIKDVNLIFSGDQGNSWYKMNMDFKSDYYVAEILEVPDGAQIIYYIEVILISGEKILENNEGKFFIYHVGGVERKKEIQPEKRIAPKKEISPQKKVVPKQEIPKGKSSPESVPEVQKVTPPQPKQYFKPSDSVSSSNKSPEKSMDFSRKVTEYHKEPKKISPNRPNFTIFGEPQTEKETDLRICPNCDSKIKTMWTVCPICGHKLEN